MSRVLLRASGGDLCLPDPTTIMIDRASPFFPTFADRFAWSRHKSPLTPTECLAIVARMREVLAVAYAVPAGDVQPGATCLACGHPVPVTLIDSSGCCTPCADAQP